MNKKEILLVTVLGFSLILGAAADEIIFEDSNFSKDAWSNYMDVPDAEGWEFRSLDLGGLVQGVVQEVSVKGDG